MVMMKFWDGKRVLVTGHTGFKGGWLVHTLSHLGAKIHGFALPQASKNSIYEITNVANQLETEKFCDIRDTEGLSSYIAAVKPEIILHLAAQPLVRTSYIEPVSTFEINVMGVVNLFEAARGVKDCCVILNITTDKVYRDMNWCWGYRETDTLGGKDPYAASKACSELVTQSYYESYFRDTDVNVATARSGNVIGGGDFSTDRLLPDAFVAQREHSQLVVRNQNSVRPWQHVMEPISGYLRFVEELYGGASLSGLSLNFGPQSDDEKSVAWIMEQFKLRYPAINISYASHETQMRETECLRLDSKLARAKLNWEPKWRLNKSLLKTFEWNEAWLSGDDMQLFTKQQIIEYLHS